MVLVLWCGWFYSDWFWASGVVNFGLLFGNYMVVLCGGVLVS